MPISERDMLDAAEFLIDILDKTKPAEEVSEGCVRTSEHGEWMSRARTVVRHRISQYIDNGPKKRFGPASRSSIPKALK